MSSSCLTCPPPPLQLGLIRTTSEKRYADYEAQVRMGRTQVVVEEALCRPLTSTPRVRRGVVWCRFLPQVRADLETITALRDQVRDFERTVSGLEGRVAKVRSSPSPLLKARVLLAVSTVVRRCVCPCWV